MNFELDLEKASESLVLCLEKAGVTTVPNLEFAVGMDVSDSFDDEHRGGVTDALLTRLVPWGLTFDPDKKLDVFTFSSGAENVVYVGELHAGNYQGFIRNKVIGIVTGYGMGTDYSYLIERMLKHFGWLGGVVKKAGFLGRLMGKKDEILTPEKRRSLMAVVTDGDNYDEARTTQIIKASRDRGDEAFILFLGVSNQPSSFGFLRKLEQQFSNVGFVRIQDLAGFVHSDDETLNEALITEKLLTWLKA